MPPWAMPWFGNFFGYASSWAVNAVIQLLFSGSGLFASFVLCPVLLPQLLTLEDFSNRFPLDIPPFPSQFPRRPSHVYAIYA